MNISLTILAAFFLDLLVGDPRWVPHPVKIMGKLIEFMERHLNRGKKGRERKLKGLFCLLFLLAFTFFLTYLLLKISSMLSPYLEFLFTVLLSYFCLSTRDLREHAIKIYEKLLNKELEGAKRFLSLIVSRDCSSMDEKKVIRSTVESVAENTNDGIVAPLFFLFLGGPVLSMLYKAINTLDSMIGYKNERYLDFGYFSAKTDDIFNFIPARISAFLISLSAVIYYLSFSKGLNSFISFIREGKNHPSPNSGYPEAAMAGALGIRISGPQFYGGRLSLKPFIGEDKREIEPSLIKEALALCLISAFLMLSGGLFFYGI